MNRTSAWFLDTGYLVALVSERDELHDRALRLSAGLRRALVTTPPVRVLQQQSVRMPQPRRDPLGMPGSLLHMRDPLPQFKRLLDDATPRDTSPAADSLDGVCLMIG